MSSNKYIKDNKKNIYESKIFVELNKNPSKILS